MDDWGRNIEAVADALFGKPTSRKGKELRYGSRGSLKVNIDTGFWDDFEAGAGGTTLQLIEREKGLKGKDAIEWLRGIGIVVEDRRPQSSSTPRATAKPPASDADPEPQKSKDAPKPKLVKTYDYVNEAGVLQFQVCRMEPKNFLQRRKPRDGDDPSDIKGNWVWKRDGIVQVPYRLPALIEAIADDVTIFISEGEKDVDNFADRLGVPSTCNAGGAGKWPEELTPYFRGAKVIILPDNDPQAKNQKGELQWHPDGRPKLPGQDHAKLVARSLTGAADSVMILPLPNLPAKGDGSDWIEAGGTSEELFKLAEQAMTLEEYQAYLDISFPRKPFVSNFGAFVWGEPRAARTPYQYIIKGLIPRKESVLIFGASQSGKSFFTQDIAMAVARGEDYCGRKVRRGLIIYCAAEAGTGFIDLRMPGYAAGKGIDVFDFLPFVCLSKKFDLFGDEKQVAELIDEIKKIVVMVNARCALLGLPEVELEAVVIDTLNKTTPGMDEINGKEVGIVMSRLDRIKEECNCGLWLVHHKNANGDRPRGHTSLYAAFETALEIGRIVDAKTNVAETYNDDGQPRDKRFMKVHKQREGEDGSKFPFYLRGVVIGYDEENEPIRSCTVEWIDEGRNQMKKVATRPQAAEQAYARMTEQNRITYRALRRALDEFGVAPLPRLGLPKSVSRVVDAKYWSQVYRDNFASEASDDAVRKAIQRGNNFLIANGFMARNNPWVWVTEKPVRGERQEIGRSDEEQPAPEDIVDENYFGSDEDGRREADDEEMPMSPPIVSDINIPIGEPAE
jgi:hypothetical protein